MTKGGVFDVSENIFFPKIGAWGGEVINSKSLNTNPYRVIHLFQDIDKRIRLSQIISLKSTLSKMVASQI